MMDADPGSRSDSTLEPRHLLVLPVLGSHEDGVIDWPMRTMAVAPQSTCWYTLPVLGSREDGVLDWPMRTMAVAPQPIADRPLSERFEQYPASNDADDENEESEKQTYQASDLLKASTVTARPNSETKTEETATAP